MSDRKLNKLTTKELKNLHTDTFGGTRTAAKQLYHADRPWAKGMPGDPFNKTRTDADGKVRPTRGQARENLEHMFPGITPKDPNAPDWVKVRDAMGFKDIDSAHDLKAMHREVALETDARSMDKLEGKMSKRMDALERAQQQQQKAPAAKEEPDIAPVEYSPEVQSAVNQVKEYESPFKDFKDPSVGVDYRDYVKPYLEQGESAEAQAETSKQQPQKDASNFLENYKFEVYANAAQRNDTENPQRDDYEDPQDHSSKLRLKLN